MTLQVGALGEKPKPEVFSPVFLQEGKIPFHVSSRVEESRHTEEQIYQNDLRVSLR